MAPCSSAGGRYTGYLGYHLRVLVMLLFLLLLSTSDAQNDNCFDEDDGIVFNGNSDERAAIYPRGDIVVPVGNKTEEFYCVFKHSIDPKKVYFASGGGTVLTSEIVNSTAIRLELKHLKPEKYILRCKLRKEGAKAKDAVMCSRMVSAGYPPSDVENLSCLSFNNENVNCTWSIPINPIKTFIKVNYSVPFFIKESPCPLSNSPPPYEWCFWDKSHRFQLRDTFDLRITSSNKLGTKRFIHKIDILKIVVPRKVLSEVSLVGPLRARVSWNLSYPMDVFHSGLWHYVENRVKGETHWNNVTMFFHRKNFSDFTPRRSFSVEEDLPYAWTEYEFRVRIHTGSGDVQEDKWSDFDLLHVKTKPRPPSVAPKTSLSSFEVVEGLDSRDVYVNYQDVEDRFRAGENFHYRVFVYSNGDARPMRVQPTEVNKAYFKYSSLNFKEHRFRIVSGNKEGPSDVYSEVVVPNSDCMPKKTSMFTVITNSVEGTERRKMFSLYWVPSVLSSNGQCEGSGQAIESYTIYWCKKTFGFRCKEKLEWSEIHVTELSIKDLTPIADSDTVIYERNVTSLPATEIYSFGIAANSGRFSSGIRWSNCIVDDSEPPLPPVTDVEPSPNDTKSVLVKWSLKCMSISAVPVGFNISYCKSKVQDFGHCTSEVRHVIVNKPSSSSATIPDLDSGFSYIFSVSVRSIIGEGGQSDPKILKLREDIPSGPPRNVEVSGVTNTSVTLSWDPPKKVDRGGIITDYRIAFVPPKMDNIFVAVNGDEKRIAHTLEDLSPFTNYKIEISACNAIGCGYKHVVHALFKTAAGAPDEVENFVVDTSNWRLMWDLTHCNSRNCSFEVKIPVDEVDTKVVPVLDKELLSLREEKVPCNFSQMSFGVRTKGQDQVGHFLYSNWSYVVKDALDCPPDFLSWWIICIIVAICTLSTAIIVLIVKFGWKTIMKAIEDCRQSINLPKGIQTTEPAKEPLQNLKQFSSGVQHPSTPKRGTNPPFLVYDTEDVIAPRVPENRNFSSRNRPSSVSSDEVHLIENNEEHNENRRHMSGSSSGRSSGHDSAVIMDDGRSFTPNDVEEPSRLAANKHQSAVKAVIDTKESINPSNPGPSYVQHRVIPEKGSEGYVTAWSVPSLPQLYNKDQTDALVESLGLSTPDLKVGTAIVNWEKTPRRASTGYVSMPEEYDAVKDVKLCSPPATDARKPPFDAPFSGSLHHGPLSFSRHVNLGLVTGSPKTGYVTLADSNPPISSNVSGLPRSSPYVSAGEPPNPLKSPILSQTQKTSLELEKPPPQAYCHVGSTQTPLTPGYVSASCMDKTPANTTLHGSPPYVTCGEEVPISFTSSNPLVDTHSHSHSHLQIANPRSSISPYVELKDQDRWAHPVGFHHRPSSGVSTVSENVTSKPSGPTQAHLILPTRPNTLDSTSRGRQLKDPGMQSGLSTQSSGYVSQETVVPSEANIVSPKRFLTKATSPHTVILSPSHEQASMV